MPSIIPRTAWGSQLIYELIYCWPGIGAAGTFNVGFAPAAPHIRDNPAFARQPSQIQLYAELFSKSLLSLDDWNRTSVLELAAGCGGGLRYLKTRYAPKESIGIDRSYAAAWRGRRSGVNLRQGIAAALPFEDSRFGMVVCVDALNYFATAEAMNEVARVLKPGGKLLLAECFHGTELDFERHVRGVAALGGFMLEHFHDASSGVRRSLEENSSRSTLFSYLPAFIRDRLRETLSLEGSERLENWRSGIARCALAVLIRPSLAVEKDDQQN
jgi:SAM-dependent methyltransferase